MTERLPTDQVHFVHGTPHFDYDECYSCFDDRQLLFRLVNSAKKQWAFYNDTTDTVVKVRAVFAPGSVITALQRTQLRALPAAAPQDAHDKQAAATTTAAAAAATTTAPDVTAGEVAGAQEATLEIEPGYTELFIEGTVTGFSMDFKTEAAPATDVAFVYRRPTEPYDKIYKCFKNNGNGLLFRLVNSEKKQWSFYNDTRDYVMKVTVEFANRDEVKPLGKTTMVALKEAAVAGAAAAPSTPAADAAAADMAVAVIDAHVPVAVLPAAAVAAGVPVDALLAPAAAAAATSTNVPHAVAPAAPAPAVLGPVVYVLLIEPGKTEPFIEGTPTVYKLGFTAEPYVDERVAAAEPVHFLHGAPDPAIIPNQSHVYKCFKNNGNGLLFRIVDDVHRIWAFYNDTTEYVMTATAHLPAGQDVQFGPGVQVHFAPMPAASTTSTAATDTTAAPSGSNNNTNNSADQASAARDTSAARGRDAVVDGVVATVHVPPLATAPFLVGMPAHYELVFAATPAPRHAPETAPQYVNGAPDRTLIEYDEVYKCFKEHGNGLLFRLVDTAHHRWAFYNDTTDLLATARVAFAPDAKVRALGATMIETDAEMGGVVYVAHIPPQTTMLFAEGDVDTFTTRFAATPVADAAAAATAAVAAAAHAPAGVSSIHTVASPHVRTAAAAPPATLHGAEAGVPPPQLSSSVLPPTAAAAAHVDTAAAAPPPATRGATDAEEHFL